MIFLIIINKRIIMIKNIYLFVCLIIFIFLIIIIKINYYFNTIENFKYGYNCLTCASCANGGYLIDSTDEDSNIISSQNNGDFNYFKFVNNDDDDEKIYIFNVYTDLTCDILIIGGGGSGGGNTAWDENPGGGAGGIVYIVNQVLPANTYKIKVGRGGTPYWASSKLYPENGHDSSITDIDDNVIELSVVIVGGPDKTIGLIGYGGGHGACFDFDTGKQSGTRAPPGGDGGSGGGSLYYGYGGTSTQGDTFWDGTEFVKGGHDGENAGYGARGGGGAGGKANVARGGHGRQINITGETSYSGNILYYGGGGGGDKTLGARDTTNQGYGGKGGGGTVGNTGSDGYPGREHTGGGGGGAGGYTLGGSGGSGMVVIRYL